MKSNDFVFWDEMWNVSGDTKEEKIEINKEETED